MLVPTSVEQEPWLFRLIGQGWEPSGDGQTPALEEAERSLQLPVCVRERGGTIYSNSTVQMLV